MEHESDYAMQEEHSYANMDFLFVYDSTPSEPDESPRRIMEEIETPDDDVPLINAVDGKKQVYHCNESMDEEKENITIIKQVSRRERVCVVGCPEPKRFFRVPLDKATRKLWRKRLSLTTLKKNSLVCDSHFSSNLFGGNSGRKLRRFPLPDWFIPEETIYISEAFTQTTNNNLSWEESIHNCSHPAEDCTESCEENNQIYDIDSETSEASTQTCNHLWNLTPTKIFPGMIVYNLRTKQTFVCAQVLNVYLSPSDGRMKAEVEKLNMGNLDKRITDVEKEKIANWLESRKK